jgi:hypothetical protein
MFSKSFFRLLFAYWSNLPNENLGKPDVQEICTDALLPDGRISRRFHFIASGNGGMAVLWKH